MEKDTDFLISAGKLSFAFLQYEVVYSFKNGMKHFRSFNIIWKGETLRKFYLEEPILANEELNIEDIILGHLLPQEQPKEKGTAKQRKNYNNSNTKARNTVANQFIKQFEL